jgi:hypothetical protein
MPYPPFSVTRAGIVALLTLLPSCGGDDGGCDPVDPACAASPVASVSVTSPVDSILAVGATTRLEAVARAAGGAAVDVPVQWNSSNLSVATVSGTGLVSAITAGAVTITASAGDVSTPHAMRAVEARLADVAVVLGDPALSGWTEALTAGVSSTLSGVVDDCQAALVAAHVLGVEACLDTAASLDGANGTDDALLAVSALFFDYARGLLDLGR